MGLAQIFTRACSGIDSPQVTVEVQLSGGLPKDQIVGTIKPTGLAGRYFTLTCFLLNLALDPDSFNAKFCSKFETLISRLQPGKPCRYGALYTFMN